jgi:hypothetical protein
VLHKFTVDLPKKHGEHRPLFWNSADYRKDACPWRDVCSVAKEPTDNNYV